MLDRPAFGGPETEVVYSYEMIVVPPPGVPDWHTLKVASLPSVQLVELGPSGAVDASARSAFESRQGISYIELRTKKLTGFMSKRVKPGRYAFVRVIDAAQPSGAGLACVGGDGRPFSEAAVIDLTPGATVYAGHIVMELVLTASSDPGVLQASFGKLATVPAAPDEDLKGMRVDPASILRQPAALMSCQPWTFPDLVGLRSRCAGDSREQLDKVVKTMRNNRAAMASISKISKLSLQVGPEQVLPCPD